MPGAHNQFVAKMAAVLDLTTHSAIKAELVQDQVQAAMDKARQFVADGNLGSDTPGHQGSVYDAWLSIAAARMPRLYLATACCTWWWAR